MNVIKSDVFALPDVREVKVRTATVIPYILIIVSGNQLVAFDYNYMRRWE